MPFVNGKPSKSSPWNKGKKNVQVPWNKGQTKESNPIVMNISLNLKGHENFNLELKGCFKKGRVSEKKGTGKARYYNTAEWIDLRNTMFAEADYKCLACGVRGGRLELHHLMPVSLFPEYMYNKENIMVLCRTCHTKTDTYGLSLVRKRGEFREKLKESILSQVRVETLEKVQRLVAEASVNDHASNATTSALPEREEIV